MPKRTRPTTIAELFTRLRGAEINLRDQLEKFEARRTAYQKGFIPNYVTNAQNACDAAKKAYDAALAESANTDAAREENSK